MSKYTFTITGTATLSKDLLEMANLRHVKETVKVNGADMQQSAVRYAPYDTGFLARSIELEILDGGLTARVFPTAEYAVYQEYGTRHQAGKPFIRPAFYRQQSIFLNDLSRFMK